MLGFSDLQNIINVGMLLPASEIDNQESTVVFIKATDFQVNIDNNTILIFIDRKSILKESIPSLINDDTQFLYATISNGIELILHGHLAEIFNEPEVLGFDIQVKHVLRKQSIL